MSIFNPLVSSSFTGADENPLSEGAVWTAVNTVAAFKRLSNTAQPTSFVADCAMAYTGATFSINQYSRANLTVTGTGGGSQGVGLSVRMQTGAATYYRFVIDHAASNNATLARSNAGALTTLVQWTQIFADGDQFTFGIDGTNLYVFDKNFLLVQAFDDRGAALSTIAQPGLAFSSNETSASIDNWEGGFFAFAAVGTSFGAPYHPGLSPGLGGISSARFQASNWWPYTAPVVAPSGIAYPQLERANGRGAFRGIILGER